MEIELLESDMMQAIEDADLIKNLIVELMEI